MVLETERLLLREMTQDDFNDLREILQDPCVMYAYEHDYTDEDVQVWLDRQITRYEKYGFGLWALVLKETGEMIGQAGLTMQPYNGGEIPEVGYLLKKKYWHSGYAHEAAESTRNYAFNELKMAKVYSIIKWNNEASKKVAESIGMEKEKEFIHECNGIDMPHYLFSVSNLHS